MEDDQKKRRRKKEDDLKKIKKWRRPKCFLFVFLMENDLKKNGRLTNQPKST